MISPCWIFFQPLWYGGLVQAADAPQRPLERIRRLVNLARNRAPEPLCRPMSEAPEFKDYGRGRVPQGGPALKNTTREASRGRTLARSAGRRTLRRL